ncbi:hypothetical protein GEMRC1_005955 [Eukaryota sp. GEM-RC1]
MLFLHLFNGFFLFFLIVVVNWPALFHCHSPADCAAVALHSKPLSNLSFFSVILLTSFLVYFSHSIWNFIKDFPHMRLMKSFYTETLEISNDELQLIPFHSIVGILSRDDISGESIGTIALKLCQTLCLEDNTMLALFHSEILPLDQKIFSLGPLRVDYFSKSLEWFLRKIIVNQCWAFQTVDDVKFNVRFKLSLDESRRRGLKWTLVSLITAPFSAVFILVHTFFTYTEAFYDSTSHASIKSWSNRARWTFRHLNELPHDFDEKLRGSYKPASQYLGLFKSRLSIIISRFVMYICSAFAAVLIVMLYMYGENVINIEIFGSNGRTLLWILLSVLVPTIAMTRGSLPGPDFTFHTNEALKQLFGSHEVHSRQLEG